MADAICAAAAATVVLLVGLSCPGSRSTWDVFQRSYVLDTSAFSGWGWPSFAAWLVALTMTVRLLQRESSR